MYWLGVYIGGVRWHKQLVIIKEKWAKWLEWEKVNSKW